MSEAAACIECGNAPGRLTVDGLCARCVALFAFGEPENAEPPLPSPRHCHGYDLLEEIARGGMGVVFRARQRSLNRVVAVKMILAGSLASETEIRRFKREAEAAASLRHPHIVAIHEVGEEDGQHFFSMDYVEGPNLGALVSAGPLAPRRAADYLRKIADAIEHAHARGLLHRDLKPSNILIDTHDEPRVTDFGLARWMARAQDLTITGQLVGTPGFMPPESAAGRTSEPGPATDVYSLGAILYFCLAGRPPFLGRSVQETLHKIFNEEPPPLRQFNPEAPVDLATICDRCMEKDPAHRYSSAAAVRDELDRFLTGKPIHARPLGPLHRAWRVCGRHRLVSVLSAVLALVSILSLSLALRQLSLAKKRGTQEGSPSGVQHASPATARPPPGIPSLPLLSASGGSCVIQGRLYVITGADGYAGMRAYLHVYDPDTNGWAVLAKPPIARSGGAYGVLNGQWHVAGGMNLEGYQSRLDVYNPASDTWTVKHAMRTIRTGCAGAVMNGEFYVIGGAVGTNIYDRVEIYNPSSDSWRVGVPLPSPRANSAAVTLGNVIYVIGGHDDLHAESRGSLFAFDAQSSQWSSREQMLVPRSNTAAVVLENKLYICGGFYGGESASFLCYDPQTDKWRAMPSMPAPRFQGDGAQVMNGRIWVIGGWNTVRAGQSLPSDTIFIYDRRLDSWSESSRL